MLFKVDSEATGCADQGDNVELKWDRLGEKGSGLPGQSKSSIEHLNILQQRSFFEKEDPVGEDIYLTTENFSTSHDGA